MPLPAHSSWVDSLQKTQQYPCVRKYKVFAFFCNQTKYSLKFHYIWNIYWYWWLYITFALYYTDGYILPVFYFISLGTGQALYMIIYDKRTTAILNLIPPTRDEIAAPIKQMTIAINYSLSILYDKIINRSNQHHVILPPIPLLMHCFS